MKDFFKARKKTKITAIIIIILIGGYFIFFNDNKLEFEVQAAEIGTIQQVVSETGVVEASDDVTLSFARSGRISALYFGKGDRVEKGQTIAVLNTGSLNAQLQQAEASLEKVLTEKDIQRAEISLSGTKQDLVNTLIDTYITIDDAIRNKADQAFVSDGTDSPEIIYAGNSYTDRQNINTDRRELQWVLKKWNNLLQGLDVNSDFGPHIDTANKNLLIIRNYLNDLSFLVNKFQANTTVTAANISTYQAAVYSARSAVNTAISTLNSTVESYESEKTTLDQIDNSESELVALQNIKVKELQAQIDSIQAQMRDAVIVSPISGTVTKVLYSLGESVSANSPIVSVISDSNFEISVNIPEDDIANVSVADQAEVTFDPYDNLVFEAEVVYVSNSAEVVDGVPVFEVTLQFKEQDGRIKAGLSADIDIIAEKIENVLVISSRSVVDEPNGQFVRILDKTEENTYIKTPVKLGLKGEGGVIQVINGVKEGDEIITFVGNSTLEKFNQK